MGSYANGVWRMIARCTVRRAAPCIKTSLLLVSCSNLHSDVKNAPVPINFPQFSHMSHEALIRQACSLTVSSSSQLLTQVLIAIIENGKDYRKAMSELMQLLEDSLLVINNTGSTLQDEINDLIVERRNLVDDRRKAIMDLVSLMEYVEKTVTSSAETSFLAGAEESSTLICERLNSALEKVMQERAANKQMEEELLHLHESYVYKLGELANAKLKKDSSDPAQDNTDDNTKGELSTETDTE